MCSTFLASANPRTRGCERCGKLPDAHDHPAAEYFDEDRTVPRNRPLELELLTIAAQAGGTPPHVAEALHRYADGRAAPGGVRANLRGRQEMIEEIADACNYGPWTIDQLYDAWLDGDSEATAEYEDIMCALRHLTAAFAALTRRPLPT